MVQFSDRSQSDGLVIDDHLLLWSEIAHHFRQGGILLGNGFSCAVWEKFGYASLYERAASGDIQHPLSNEDIRLFELMKTQNFELVLSTLSNTRMVNDIFHQDYSQFEERCEHIKNSLGEAVRAVHLPWLMATEKVLVAIRDELKQYRSIYSTNYDLLAYWAVMSQGAGQGFKDYFWTNDCSFDITDTEIRNRTATRILYLHGALHLYRDLTSGRTHKLVSRQFENILERLEVPLFITEGSSEDKMRAIRSSDYLSFAYTEFMKHSGPLVIFGHSLGDTDQHLLNAIRKHKPDKIAVSIRATNSPESIVKKKVDLQASLWRGKSQSERPELIFFDAATHPLGSPDIRIEEDASAFSFADVF